MNDDPSRPPDRRPKFDAARLGVPSLLVLAAIILVAPWDLARGRFPDPGTFALATILLCYGLTAWRLGKAPETQPPVPIDLAPILDRLDRLIAAVEARPASTAAVAGQDLGAIAAAISGRRWGEAEGLLAEAVDHPGAVGLADRLDVARREAGDRLAAELKAAQDVGDADRVLEVHEGLRPVLPADAREELDTRVVKWFMALIMKRLRGGTVRADVAELATRVADRFPGNIEGASLRASLPTLRRSAGLCSRCSAPYRGIADACPKCLAPPPIPSTPATEPAEDDILPEAATAEDRIFTDPFEGP